MVILGNQSLAFLAIVPLLAVWVWAERRWHQLSVNHYLARLILAAIGYATDSLMQAIFLIDFSPSPSQDAVMLAPLWLLLMWLWFSFTLASCYQWLLDKPVVAIVFAALFGPLAYWAASRLSPVSIVEPMGFTLLSFIFWGTMFAVIFTVAPIRTLLVPQAQKYRAKEIFETS